MPEPPSNDFQTDRLRVEVYPDRARLGSAAADRAAAALRDLIAKRGFANVIFAAAPSQTETLAGLADVDSIDWKKITAFHLDEYVGTRPGDAHSFRRFLNRHLLSKVPIGRFEALRGESEDLEAECERYARLLEAHPPEVGLLGIGENGHLAFNDPPEARFDDPQSVRVVDLTEDCRRQQVNDGAFSSLAEVPEKALTVTISRLMRIPRLFVMVPGLRKAAAVRRTIEDPVSEACPSSILRAHPNATLFLDQDAASGLKARKRS